MMGFSYSCDDRLFIHQATLWGRDQHLFHLGMGRIMVSKGYGHGKKGSFLNDMSCLPIKDSASIVVSKNIKLYRPLVANGGDKPSN